MRSLFDVLRTSSDCKLPSSGVTLFSFLPVFRKNYTCALKFCDIDVLCVQMLCCCQMLPI